LTQRGSDGVGGESGHRNLASRSQAAAIRTNLSRKRDRCGGIAGADPEDLKDLGVSLAGHRRKLLAAISALRSGLTPDSVASAASERRHLTVMFCDLVGSTALSVRRDPEDLRT
jgi:class 3 adenylate cyclase